MVYDFHTHTTWSDGDLAPPEQIRRALVAGYRCLGITDHTGIGGVAALMEALRQDRALVEGIWDIEVLIGVELTHVPARSIAEAARFAKEHGADIVVVHGETPVEPVEPGTNAAAIACPDVDILAHPGFLTADNAAEAAANGTFIEITARRGHSLTNGHVVRVGMAAGVSFLVNSDAHGPGDFLSDSFARRVALGAGLDEELLEATLADNPRALLERVRRRALRSML